MSSLNVHPFFSNFCFILAPYYVAPEVLTDDYTNKCDVWSIGVLAYILLCGYLPFHGSGDRETLKLVQEGKLEFPSREWDTVSEDAKVFVKCLLQVDPDKRPTASDALQYKWIKKHYTPVNTEDLKYTNRNSKPPRPTRIKLNFKSSNSGTSKNVSDKYRSGLRKFLDTLKGKNRS